MQSVRADILVLGGIDYDHDQLALTALRASIGGPDRYPHAFSRTPNAGVPTGLDLDGNDRLGEARDAQGYGRFPGQGGLAVLSRWPVRLIADHSKVLWRDVPGSLLIDARGRVGDKATGADVQRLSSTVHWELQISPPGLTPLTLMVFHATPPVFDGPEDRNGRRNADEVKFWTHRLNGSLGAPPKPPLVILGTFNLDPEAGQGRRQLMRDVLADPRLQDPTGLSGRATAHWPDPGPGSMRVDYILPSSDLTVLGSDLLPLAPEVAAHSPIMVTIDLPRISPE